MLALLPRPSRTLPLQNGDHLTRDEFERRFDATPNLKRAELIDGNVFIEPPVSLTHAVPHADLICVLGVYMASTPGVKTGDSTSIRLDLDNMPQPDGCLFIVPERGGQVRISSDGYIEGAPELIAEIAASSASYDLHDKLHVYRRHGVREYIVWRVLEDAVDYFQLQSGQYVPLPPVEGVHRSQVFGGLWLDTGALLRRDLAGALAMVQRGLAAAEHRDFVARLAAHA